MSGEWIAAVLMLALFIYTLMIPSMYDPAYWLKRRDKEHALHEDKQEVHKR